jgi:hypothetical protein
MSLRAGDSSEDKDSGSRKLSLSPTQFLDSFATGVLGGSKPIQQESPMQALGAKRNEKLHAWLSQV